MNNWFWIGAQFGFGFYFAITLTDLVTSIVKSLRQDRQKKQRTCGDCRHRGTMDCPPSHLCYADKDKPYFNHE